MQQALISAVQCASYDKLKETVRTGKTAALAGVTESQAVFLASALSAELECRSLVLTSNDLRASHAAEDAAQLMTAGAASLTCGELDLTRGYSSREASWRRLEVLTNIARGRIRLLTTSADALMLRMGPPEVFRQSILNLRAGDRLPPETLIQRMTMMGYERVDMVEGKGQCALRGSILDLYPPSSTHGLRIEYFDDEIDQIREFDTISQRSLDSVEEALISPCSEILLDEADCQTGAERMRLAVAGMRNQGTPETPKAFADLPPLPADEEDEPASQGAKRAAGRDGKSLSAAAQAEYERRVEALNEDAAQLETGMPFKRIRTWLPVLTDEVYTLLDWYRPELVILCEPDRLQERCRERQTSYLQDLTAAMERFEAVRAQEGLLLTWPDLAEKLKGRALITASEILLGQGGLRPDTVLNLDSAPASEYSSQIRPLAEQVKEWAGKNYRIALLSGGVARGERLQNALTELEAPAAFAEHTQELQPGRATILPLTLSHGFVWPETKLAVVSDTDIWGSAYRKSKSRKTSGEKIAAFTDLKTGDYVVHEDHGVGIYQGTVHLQNGGAYRDYLLIQYAGKDRLYVPIDQLQRVQRYIGNPSAPPRINKLGGGEWGRQKGKVKEGLRKLAFDLTALYAERARTDGHAFSPDGPWQREFEDQFPYELTPDQKQSVREITADMESPKNMDRLLIGDVGYGKTEVSLRAAFKAVMDGKQVAILAPTTILVQQHYHTVLKRFASFPVRVEVLSRFRSAKELREAAADISAGKVDIVIGTHRMLAKDIHFKDLGLLIVDEEQRFGVQHKETIKNMKKQMDVLTLSATPIPRTLHMSMTGIRDMSVLETPPEDRLPVRTHVLEYSDAQVRDAILREISRGGQVYFLYNRVNSIERFYQRLRVLVPEARIGVAHGQMKEHGLEDVMLDFYNGSYDVLLCTTIIESGLDVPTANTLIVFDADRFGLSQLYQLRGRVGRSTVQAYAFFTVRQNTILSETAQQRLSAIREFTEFGAGFRIAMRDLEIRGAGNLLGPEQHGHLATVGYEMYCRMIEEAVSEAKGIPDRSELETRVDLQVDAFLPQEYVRDEHQRMEMYKRIAGMGSEADREDVTDELLDRFGELPQPVNNLLDVAQLRYLCSHVGASQVLHRADALFLKMDTRFVPEPMTLLKAIQETDKRLSVSTAKLPALLLKGTWENEEQLLHEAVKVMRKLVIRLDALTEKNVS